MTVLGHVQAMRNVQMHMSFFFLHAFGIEWFRTLISNITGMMNTGNFTFYENITFTKTLTLGIAHFTSPQYHFVNAGLKFPIFTGIEIPKNAGLKFPT